MAAGYRPNLREDLVVFSRNQTSWGQSPAAGDQSTTARAMKMLVREDELVLDAAQTKYVFKSQR
jgi:hypothetical protein